MWLVIPLGVYLADIALIETRSVVRCEGTFLCVGSVLVFR
jgi:hypothetical protein